MIEGLKLISKGIIIGIGKIIPGVSGGMLAISLNVYDKSLQAISNFFKEPKNNFLFLTKLGIGIVLAILVFSKAITFSLNNYYLPTMLLFIGLILGGIPSIIKKVRTERCLKNYNIMFGAILVILIIAIFSSLFRTNKPLTMSFYIFIIMGIIEAITMIIPGISGTAILMMLGYYKVIIEAFGNLTDVSLFRNSMEIVVPFLIGLIVGIIVLSKIINYILKKETIKSYYAILGFVIGSIILLIKEVFIGVYSLTEIVISLGLLFIGFAISKRLDEKR